MTILAQTIHTFNSGDTTVGAQIDGGNLVIGETRNDEHASEGRFDHMLTVIPLADAIAMAKAILASNAQEQADEDTAYEAWLEEEYQRRQDHLALVDSALEHEISF